MFFFLILVLTVFVYCYIKRSCNYWKDRNVTYLKPDFLRDLLKFNTQQPEESCVSINKLKERYIGSFMFNKPILLIRDHALAKNIGIKWFNSFENHKSGVPKFADPFWNKIMFCSDVKDNWKQLKTMIKPLSTTKHLTSLHGLMLKCAKHLTEHYQNNKGITEVEVKDIFTKFGIDLIGASIFDKHCNSYKNPQSEFYLMMCKITDFSGLKKYKLLGFDLIPYIMKLLGIRMINNNAKKYITMLLDNTFECRKKSQIKHLDLTQLLMEALNKSVNDHDQHIAGNDGNILKSSIENMKMDMDCAVAIIIEYILAVVLVIPNVLSFLANELALNPDIQEKIYKETELVLKSNNGNQSFKTLSEMKYLDMVLLESMRKWPDNWFVERICTKSFIIEPEKEHEKPLLVEKGIQCILPVLAMHRNQDYHENPMIFDPERFNDKNKDNTKIYYMPFGIGPRSCPGSRFAILVMKCVMAELITNFRIVSVKNTETPLCLRTQAFNFYPPNGLWLGLQPRTTAP